MKYLESVHSVPTRDDAHHVPLQCQVTSYFQEELQYRRTMTSVTRSWRCISTTMRIVVLSAEQGHVSHYNRMPHSELSIMDYLAPEEWWFARCRFSITHLINLLLIYVLKTATCDCDVIISFSNKCEEKSLRTESRRAAQGIHHDYRKSRIITVFTVSQNIQGGWEVSRH